MKPGEACPSPALPEEGLKRALVFVKRAAECALAELAELLGSAAVLGLRVAARVALLNELAQRLGQVHLRGLLQLYRDEVRHGRRKEQGGGGQHPPPSPQPTASTRTAALAPRFRDHRTLPNAASSRHVTHTHAPPSNRAGAEPPCCPRSYGGLRRACGLCGNARSVPCRGVAGAGGGRYEASAECLEHGEGGGELACLLWRSGV